MALASGTRFGHYEIIRAIGAGGMGEVYRARDTKLGRDVAVKTLPESFSQDPERVARFGREARLLAAFSHPHIAAVHGLEESGGVQCLIMELVEGETLAQRLTQGPLPVAEAIVVARQLADGLHAAHERGLIHRDLKPSNIAFATDGQIKILDFGLAKFADVTSGNTPANDSISPTLSMAATRAGVIRGTIIVGESPRGLPGKPGNRETFVLPNSHIVIDYSQKIDSSAFRGPRTPLAVDLPAQPRFDAAIAGQDPALEAIVTSLRKIAASPYRLSAQGSRHH